MKTSFLIRPCTFQLEDACLPAQSGYALINGCPCANAPHIASITALLRRGGRAELVLTEAPGQEMWWQHRKGAPLGQAHKLCQSGAAGPAIQLAHPSTLIITPKERKGEKHLQLCAEFLTPPTLLKSPPLPLIRSISASLHSRFLLPTTV